MAQWGEMRQSGETRLKHSALTRSDWIGAAREILTTEGVSSLSLRRIAARLNATTGAFYWLFSNLEDMLDGLRMDWQTRNSAAFDRVFDSPDLDCHGKYIGYVRVLLQEGAYDPNYDSAMRDWAHSSELTRAVLTEVDNRRIAQLQTMFADMGFSPRASRVRALTTYFHQSGYYRMEIDETLEERLANIPYYAEILVGPGYISADLPIEDLRRLVFGDTPGADRQE